MVHIARTEILRLEEATFRAWPALTVAVHRGMRLRATGGDSRRANSAAVFECEPALTAEEAIVAAESFYAARARPCRFQLNPVAPAGLEDALAARRYEIEAPVWVQTAPIETMLARMKPLRPRVHARVEGAPDPVWTDIEIARGRYADIASTFLALLARLGSRAGFATAHVGDTPAAAALFVLDDDVVVVQAMRTVGELRRSGAARALLDAGASWAADRGAVLAVLQVETDNEAALALYASAGFETRYGYHYRVRDAPPKSQARGTSF